MHSKTINKLAFLISLSLLSTPTFADDKSNDKKKYKEKIVKTYESSRGKKATQAALDAEIANRISADKALQKNINAISLTPGPKGDAGAIGPQGKDGADGVSGLNCWDINQDGSADANEDLNGDGLWDTKDCRGSASSGNVPVIWSGYCATDGKGVGFTKYCASNVNFNTANAHLAVNPDGNFTVITPGYYRIHADAISNTIYSQVQFVVNGVAKDYKKNHSNRLVPMSVDTIVPLSADDTFYVTYYSGGGNDYAYLGSATHYPFGKIEVIYMGPLQ